MFLGLLFLMLKIVHLTTVHRRDDVRIVFKECETLASFYPDTSLVVFDGLGSSFNGNINVDDLGLPARNRIKRMVIGFKRVLQSRSVADADVVHFHDPELLIVGLILKLRGKKVIYDSHEDVPRQIANKHWIPPLLRGLIAGGVEFVEMLVAKRIDAVVAATPLIADRFLRVNSKTTIVRNFPLLGEFLGIPLDKPDSRVVCYIGALTRERGILELLEALVILGDVRLLVCGPFQSDEFEAELRTHPGWRYIDYLGIVGRREVANVLARARIGLVTLLPTPNQVEALPVKMFEYMASGTPFLASNFPLWLQIAKDSGGGECVDPGDPNRIASSLRRMLAEPDALKSMGLAGRLAAVDRYNWEPEGCALVELYRSLIQDSSVRG